MGSNKDLQLVGCFGKHGSYSFFKSIKISGRSYTISSHFPVRIWPDSPVLSIAEIQLIWTDRNESFCSLKLYFLPENTPDGRQQHHGEHELIALQEKVVIRAPDLMSWLVEDDAWDWGFLTPADSSTKTPSTLLSKAFSSEKFRRNEKEHIDFIPDLGSSRVVVLNYERYIRLRTVLKRLEGSKDSNNWLSHPLVLALGGIAIGPNCHLLFAKEIFDLPELEDHELICNHLAPKLKGKPSGVKKRRRKRHPSMGSDSNASESSSGSSYGSNEKATAKKVVNGVAKIKTEHEESFSRRKSIDANYVPSGIKDEDRHDKNSNIKKIVNKLFSDANNRPVENGRVGSGRTRSGRYDVKDENSMQNELLGSLGELAQKLGGQGALSILPIRPDLLPESEKRRGSRLDANLLQNNLDALANLRMLPQADMDFLTRSWNGQLGLGLQNLLYGAQQQQQLQQQQQQPSAVQPPPRQSSTSSSKHKSSSRSDLLQSPPSSSIKPNQSKSDKPTISVTPLDPNKSGAIPTLRFTSPSPFVPTSRIYGDPTVLQKPGSGTNSNRTSEQGVIRAAPPLPSDIIDFSAKRRKLNSEQSSSSASALSSQLNSSGKTPTEAEFLMDLSSKLAAAHGQQNKQNILFQNFHNLANIPPPSHLRDNGLRLTSEVTLFPSNPAAASATSSSSSGHNKSNNNNSSSNNTKGSSNNSQNKSQHQNHSNQQQLNHSSGNSGGGSKPWGSTGESGGGRSGRGNREAQSSKGSSGSSNNNNNPYRSSSSSSSNMKPPPGMNDINSLGLLDPHSLAFGVHKLAPQSSSRSSSSSKGHKNGQHSQQQQMQQFPLLLSSGSGSSSTKDRLSAPSSKSGEGREKSSSSSQYRSGSGSSSSGNNNNSNNNSSRDSSANNHLGIPGLSNLHPQFFPKIDPAYLHLFGAGMPMFMPPTASLLGMNMPGMNIEQFQLYKDLLQSGMAPQFPVWPHETGPKERGPK